MTYRRDSVVKRIEELEKEVKDLRSFRQRIEAGSWVLRCIIYSIGGIAIFVTSILTIFEKWPFK